ncbi:MAG: DUF1080 domain-containing protein [Planctomycetaceae bacterium]|jgi:flagellar biosynthesis GTPase FlhF|nr:DUF1080 domain-containing protein [Planctomycetaceae bacterium]
MMRVRETLAVTALVWWCGITGGWEVMADDAAKPKTPAAPAFQAVKTSDEAVARIRQLGGRVHQLSAKRKVLVVDLRFVVEGFSDDHLQYIPVLKDVVVVRLKRVAVTDAGLKHLVAVSTIEELDLSETAVSDAGLKIIARLPALKTLNLFGTSITDAGLIQLKPVKTLRRLFIDRTRTSVAGIADLKSSNAGLAVVPDRPETRRRIAALVEVARKLLAESKTAVAAAAKAHDQLTPKVGALKKNEDATKAASEAAKKQSDAANKAQAETKKAVDQAAAKLKAATEKYTATKKLADAAKAKAAAAGKKAAEAKQQHERAKKAKPAFDLAKRIQVASQLRLADARRRQVISPGAPFEPRQDKLPSPVPPGATVLFDGSDTTKFLSKTGEKINWPIEEGNLVSTKGGSNSNHVVSSVHFRDAVIHVEFLLPPKGSGNSGVYIHGNYELQIIRSHGKKEVTQKDMGAVYGFAKPLVNAARKPGQWQVYDILYRAPRRDDKQKIVKKGSITAWLNGQLVQQNTRFGEPRSVYHPYRHQTTPYLKAIFEKQKKTMTGPVFLQDHGHPTRFRNVWILPLDDQLQGYKPQ